MQISKIKPKSILSCLKLLIAQAMHFVRHEMLTIQVSGDKFVLFVVFGFFSTGMSRRFNHEPQSTTTWEGSVARFSCQIHKAVPPAKITWEKDGSSLTSSDRIFILDQGILQIKNIKKADEGKYRCIAKNVAKTRQSQIASLIILSGKNCVL